MPESDSTSTTAHGPWTTRVMRATLPIGIVLSVVWCVYFLAIPLFVDVERSGLAIATATSGLLSSVLAIVSGYRFRRELRRP